MTFPFTRLLSRMRFRTKLGLGLSGIVLSMALALLPIVGNMHAESLVEESKKRGTALLDSLVARSADPLLAQDFLRLKDMVDDLSNAEGIIYAFVQDERGFVLAHSFQGGFPVDLMEVNHPDDSGGVRILLLNTGSELIYDLAAKVTLDDQQLGTARIGLSRSSVMSTVQAHVFTLAILFGGALFVALGLANIFARTVTKRIESLRHYAEEIVRGNLEIESGTTLPTNCWEAQECSLTRCPAHGDPARRCWYVAGTLCPECGTDDYPAKIDSCRDCDFYREHAGDEIQDLTETFDVMSYTLKSHISELENAERVLTEQQRVLRTVMDATPDRVSMLDRNLTYQAANKAFADMVGMSQQEIKGRTDYHLFPEKEARERQELTIRIMKEGKPYDRELRMEENSEERWYHVVCIPVKGQDGNVMGMLRTARDVTEMKRVQEQLIQAQKMESIGKLAGGVAHEINTPLGVILGYAQLMMEDVTPDSQMFKDLGTIEKQAKVCRKIVADLLGFSRQSQSDKVPMCFNNSVMEAISLVKHAFSLDRVKIVPQLDDRYPIIHGDPEKLKQVWINLLGNAHDAIGPDGGMILVRTKLDTPGGKVTLQIADSGSGITKEDLKKIFDPFFSTKSVGEGTGLGLSVSFGIIEDHEGDIAAHSPLPKDPTLPHDGGPGTMFTVHLPLDQGTYMKGASEEA